MNAPHNRDPALETYMKVVRDDIHRALNSRPVCQTCDDMSSTERKALLLLRSRSDIVIKPVDNGSTIVVMSRQDYLDKVMSHLQNEKFYMKVDEKPCCVMLKKLRVLLQKRRTDKLLIRKPLNIFSH